MVLSCGSLPQGATHGSGLQLVVVRSAAERMREREPRGERALMPRECCDRVGTPLERAARLQRMQPVMRRAW